jgi:hypothetical protein
MLPIVGLFAVLLVSGAGFGLLLRRTEEKWQAKRHNEGVKLLASLLNAIAIAMIVTARLFPPSPGAAWTGASSSG